MSKDQHIEHYTAAVECIVKAYEHYNEHKDPQAVQDILTEMTYHFDFLGTKENIYACMRESDHELAEACAFVQGFLSGSKWGYTVGVDSAELGREQNELSKRIN